MKAKICTVAVLMAITLTACREYEITTKIYPDGSCERIMFVRGDSSEVVENPRFPIPIDSTWTLSMKADADDDDNIIYTAKKKFASVAQMNAALYNEKGDDVRVNIRSTLQRRFRWFFTFLKYQEEYKPIFTKIPISNQLRPEELEVLLEENDEETEKDSFEFEQLKEDAEEKAEEWFKRLIFEEFYDVFVAGAQKLNDPALTVDLISSRKQELYEKSDEDPDQASDLLEAFEEVLKTPAVWKVAEIHRDAFQLFNKKLELAASPFQDDYIIKIIMPGLIIGTNAKNVEGNQVSWGEEDGDEIRLFYVGHEIWVESRVVNWWAVYISIGVAFLLLLSIVATLRRRK